MELKDYYAIMGVKPTDDLKTIKTAYRRLARKYHPDVSKEPDAEARFKEVAEAWEVLSDEQRRAEYDQLWQHRNDPQFNRQFQQHEGQPYNAEDFDDIFSSIFGQHGRHSHHRHAARGHDIEIEVAVFSKKRWKSTSVRLAIPSPFITRSAGGAGNSQNIECENPGWRQQRATNQTERPGTPGKTADLMAIYGSLSILPRIRSLISSIRIWKSSFRLPHGRRRSALRCLCQRLKSVFC